MALYGDAKFYLQLYNLAKRFLFMLLFGMCGSFNGTEAAVR